MPIRKNKKRIDPRYFLNETTHRDLIIENEIKIADLSTTYGQLARDKHPVLMLAPNAFVQLRNFGQDGQGGVALDFSTLPNMSQPGMLDSEGPGQGIELLIKGLQALVKKGSVYGIDIPQTDTVKVVG